MKLVGHVIAYLDGTLHQICEAERFHKDDGKHTVVYLQGGVWHLEVWGL